MSVDISWTKEWTSSDDGTILGGADLGNIQTNVASHLHTESVNVTGSQTISGNKTFTGTTTFSGTVTNFIKNDEFVFLDDEIISMDNDVVYYPA